MYTEKVVEHFRHPHNMGKLADFSAVGKVGNIVCGDVLWLYIRVDKDEEGREILADVSWETFGCTAAIATSSMVSDLAKGKTLEQAIEITNRDVATELGGLPPVKMHCSALAAEALGEAVYDYLVKQGRPIPERLRLRHEHIQKDVAALEKRYAAFLGADEQAKGSPGCGSCT
ncbi:MAG: iron-sulfur cluster assembly scaffold protein [Candidatus Bipolaricaulota bacterium]